MDVLRLRTMTLKSRFDGGKYENQTVETVLKLEKSYLIYEYFKMSKLSFTDRVLDLLGIDTNFRIQKPGNSSEMFHKFNKNRIDKMSQTDRDKHFIEKKRQRSKRAKLKQMRYLNSEKRTYSKQSLRRMNHSNVNFNLTHHSTNPTTNYLIQKP